MKPTNSSDPTTPSQDAANSADAGAVPLVTIGSPAEILSAVPYLLGFHPRHSIVAIGTRPPRDRVHVCFRYDLPDPTNSGHAREIAAHAVGTLAGQQVTQAIVAGYGPGALVTPVAEELRAELGAAGIRLREMLRVDGGRYWSYLCDDPACCGAEGTPFDVTTSPVAAQLTLAGNPVLPDRAALERTIAPLGGMTRTSMRQATTRAESRAASLAAHAARSGRGRRAILRPLIDNGLRAVSQAIDTYRNGGFITSHDEIAWLTVTLINLPVRDDAWARMDPRYSQAHQRLWTDAVRHAEPGYVPAPACLLAFTAWQSGNGALANIAVARALEAEPGYTMALLIQEAVGRGLPPSTARLPMTPEEVAASYAGEGRRRPGRRRPSA